MEDTRNAPAPEQRLADDLRTLIEEGEALLRGVASEADALGADAQQRLAEQLESARVRLAELEKVATERTKAAAKATDDWVHDNPWQAVGIGVGVGLVVGLLIGRR
jgi:ElaB/YqjD/DUF883 family membrane-anchored ribosome-binding protein